MAVYLLVVTAVDVVWWVEPTHLHSSVWFVLMDVGALLGIGGIWATAYVYFLRHRRCSRRTRRTSCRRGTTMSTTNRPPGGTGDGPHPGAGHQWPNDVTDLSRGDDSGGGGGVDPAAPAGRARAGRLRRPPDPGGARWPWSSSFVIAISVAVGGFWYLMSQDPNDPYAHPDAVARGDVPLNDRLSRTDRFGMRENDPLREVDQPRLEPLKRWRLNGKTTTRPELPTGNSPQIHPEEIGPDR